MCGVFFFPCADFSIVHQYIQRFNEVSGNKTAIIRRTSKIPGVLITQCVTELPDGASTPDFQCKVEPISISQGRTAIFKAKVTGTPKPEVSWRRTKGTLSDKQKFQSKYDKSTEEYILQINKVSADETDTYKCCAVNEYGKAISTTTLTVTDTLSDPTDFRKLLRRSKLEENQTKPADGERDKKFWDAMLNADSKDYERICAEFGVGDLDVILKKLEQKKREQAQNKDLDGVKAGGEGATEVNNSTSAEMAKALSIISMLQKNTGQDAMDLTEDDLLLLTDFKLSDLEFVIKIQEIQAQEGDDALFECVLTHPLPRITWKGKGSVLKDGEKYSIGVSTHKLIHRLMIKDCTLQDKGIYSAENGSTSCSAWLVVEDPSEEGSQSEEGSENEASYSDESETENIENGEDSKDHKRRGGKKNGAGSTKGSQRKRKGRLIEDALIDPGVHFICGLSDVSAIINESAELTCKLSSEDCEGVWFRDGKKISPDDHFSITKDGAIHKLLIIKCEEELAGKYRFEADGRKTEAMITVKDPPRIYTEDLNAFTEPLTVKVGHNAIFKVQFVGHEPIKVQWYKEGEELHDDSNTKLERCSGQSRLLLSRCHRKHAGEIKIKLKNEHGFTEATSQLMVLDKPTPPQGPTEVTESSAVCIEFRWRPPKDDGGSPVVNYIMERQQVGRNTWKKVGEIPGVPTYRDTDVDHGRKYCYRIRAVTAEGTSNVMETDKMQAGKLSFPGPPALPKVASAFNDCITLSWDSPSNKGGSRILGYILEKRKKGSNLWTVVNAMDELIKERTFAVKDVVEGMEYEFRVTAINISGAGEFSSPSEFVFARDPKKPPGKVTGLKVTETSYTHLVLTWMKPEDKPGIQDEAKGYFVEIRQADCIEWSRCNTTTLITTTFSVKGLRSMDMYWLRVIATNDGGESAPQELANYVIAMPSPVRPKFTTRKMKSFMVVKAGNSVRITINFEASPQPDIMWLKDNVPVAKRVTISNSDGSSQLLIPSSERSDSGIYSIVVKNLVGQETFSTEVRVTDDPKPPGVVDLEENVPGTVTVIWEASPDEKRDDRLHYTVSKLDSTKRMWSTVADRLFNNKFTVCNIMLGREYNFRVYAKNDMGISAPSESPTWCMEKKKEKFVVSLPTMRDCDLHCAPAFIVPLKLHIAPKGYECHMSCAVSGNPKPRVTWYRNHVSLNTNTNYYISNTCGVCSMLILRVGPKDVGEYTVTAENSLGRAECSTMLSVKGDREGKTRRFVGFRGK
ncbi:immunoglobulin-like and fibronectin type III domain-containing protein 1 [Nelusetta ayraudi]|uniref:immunoglobulin-like and fibronectin type III domain-containing protein 1 n=1 Tax=Nelusetta ayraudi TaxID=303726 RepID=UPI003F708275